MRDSIHQFDFFISATSWNGLSMGRLFGDKLDSTFLLGQLVCTFLNNRLTTSKNIVNFILVVYFER